MCKHCSTQTSSFQELRDTWKRKYDLSQGKAFQQHKSLWLNHVYRNWEVLEQSRAQHKENKKLKTRLSLIFDLVQRLLANRKPSFNYSVFLRERLAFLQVKVIRDGLPHQVSTPQQFIETFAVASNSEQNLLCELYLHNEAMPEDRKLNLIPLVGDIQIRAFVSFLANQLTWKNAFMSATHNKENCLLWIRAEPQNVVVFIVEHQRVLREPGMTGHIRKLQAAVLEDCQHYVKCYETSSRKYRKDRSTP